MPPRFRTLLLSACLFALACLAPSLSIAAKTGGSAAGGDNARAIEHARTARKLEPWASSPYLQLALAAEQAGDLGAARAWIDGATRRDPENWRPWLVEARIATEQGDIGAARRALGRAAALNPRSPLFAGVRPRR